MATTIEITIPVLDEEAALIKYIDILYNYLQENILNSYQCSIIIADNGSTDKTPEIAAELCKNNPHIKYLRVGERGIGLALKKSWADSNADIIGSMDLDLSVDITHFKKAIAKILDKDYDIVYASRLHRDAKVYNRTLLREIISRIYNMILKLYLGTRISDSMCGFTFMKRSILSDLLKNGATNNRWFFQSEIIVVSEWMNFKIYELPVVWKDDRDSKVKIVSLALEYLSAMRQLKRYRPKKGNRSQ